MNRLLRPDENPESILQEAQRLTHGDRATDYGHPLDDYTRTAALVSALLAHKLKAPLEPHEMAMAMICVKLSRQIHSPKRDNAVDGAGYFWVSQECIDETERRASATVAITDIHSEGCPALRGEKCHCPELRIAAANRRLQLNNHPAPCMVNNGGSECSCPGREATLVERAGVDRVPNSTCAVSGWRIAPVVGCKCANCTVARNIAATGV